MNKFVIKLAIQIDDPPDPGHRFPVKVPGNLAGIFMEVSSCALFFREAVRGFDPLEVTILLDVKALGVPVGGQEAIPLFGFPQQFMGDRGLDEGDDLRPVYFEFLDRRPFLGIEGNLKDADPALSASDLTLDLGLQALPASLSIRSYAGRPRAVSQSCDTSHYEHLHALDNVRTCQDL